MLNARVCCFIGMMNLAACLCIKCDAKTPHHVRAAFAQERAFQDDLDRDTGWRTESLKEVMQIEAVIQSR